MQVSVEQLQGSQVRLAIEAATDDVGSAFDKAYREISRTVPVPGFRPGKAPRQWIAQVIGREVVGERARELLVEETLKQAIEGQSLDILGEPRLDLPEEVPAEGAEFSYSATVVVKPTFELPQYRGIPVEREVKAATDELVDEEIESLRAKHARIVPVTDRPAQEGDLVDIEYFVYPADQLAPVSPRRMPMVLCLGQNWFSPSLDDDVVGMSLGDAKVITRTSGGQMMNYDIRIRNIQQRILPEVNEEFAMRTTGFESVEELREDIRTRIQSQFEALTRESAINRILARLAKECRFDLPDILIRAAVRRRLIAWVSALRNDNPEMAHYLASSDAALEAAGERFRPSARAAVRRALLLDAIAKAEGITVDEAEIAAKVAELAERTGTSPDVARRQLEAQGGLADIEEEIRNAKAEELLWSAAVVTEVEKLSDAELAILDEVEELEAREDEQARAAEAEAAQAQQEAAEAAGAEAEAGTESPASPEPEASPEEASETEATPGTEAASE
ncbi:MAG TPA: trigger factor [Armatimonadota bacterium]|nr:trigger factor [Armatimonadota bacterium]